MPQSAQETDQLLYCGLTWEIDIYKRNSAILILGIRLPAWCGIERHILDIHSAVGDSAHPEILASPRSQHQ